MTRRLHRLDGCEARLVRAGQHLRYLDSAIQRFPHASGNGVREYLDHERREYKVVAVVRRELPVLKWGVVIGEALYNMRSALDHLVWQLVLENRGRPSKHTSFPVVTNPKKFAQKGLGSLVGVHEDAIALIKSFQPFNGWKDSAGGISALWLLDELCNVDKHRTFHPSQFLVKDVDLAFPRGVTVSGLRKARGPLKDDTVLARCRWAGEAAEGADMHVKLKLSFDVTFDHRGSNAEIPANLSEFPVVATLDQMLTFLTDSLFPAFRRCFR